ncbi:MAG: NHL domain/cytochrome c family protein, partial [Methylococcaceae bacterium]
SLSKEKPIAHYGHPYKDILLRSDPEKMPLLKEEDEEIEEIGVIACITCHEPHSWKPIDPHEKKPYAVLDPKKQENVEGNAISSFLRLKGVKKTFCMDCHGIEALAKYKYFHHEDKVRDIGVDYLK